jgi:NADPH:quinone reductase-like Zn-dependent oxidoreductase
VPATFDWPTAAALPVPALTADQAIRDALCVRAGEAVLVHGAGGVTGSLVVQLAQLAGARVIATAGPSGQGDCILIVIVELEQDRPEVLVIQGGAEALLGDAAACRLPAQ